MTKIQLVIFCYCLTLYRNSNALYTLVHNNSIMQKQLSTFRLFYNLLVSNDNTQITHV